MLIFFFTDALRVCILWFCSGVKFPKTLFMFQYKNSVEFKPLDIQALEFQNLVPLNKAISRRMSHFCFFYLFPKAI